MYEKSLNCFSKKMYCIIFKDSFGGQCKHFEMEGICGLQKDIVVLQDIGNLVSCMVQST